MSTSPFRPQPMPSATALGIATPLRQALRLVQSYLVHRRPTLGLALAAATAAPPNAGAPLVEIVGTVLWPVPTLTFPAPAGTPPIPVPRAMLPVIIVNAGCWSARLAVLDSPMNDTGCRFGLLTAPRPGDTAGLALQWQPLPLTGPETPTGQSLGDWLIDMIDEGLDWTPVPTRPPPPPR